jgi:hypothetical protein
MKLPVMQFSPFFRHFIPLRPKIFSKAPGSQDTLRPGLTPIQNGTKLSLIAMFLDRRPKDKRFLSGRLQPFHKLFCSLFLPAFNSVCLTPFPSIWTLPHFQTAR